MEITPFEFVKSINTGKKLEKSSSNMKAYVPFVINRTFSYFPDTLMYANEMNRNKELDPELQYDFFLNTIRPAKRFSKWAKRVDSENLEMVKRFFEYSDAKALQTLQILSDNDLEKIRQALNPGG